MGAPLYLRTPLRIHSTHDPKRVAALLRLVEEEAKAGYWVGGFLAFEAAAAFSLPVCSKTTSPLAWFAVFSSIESVCYGSVRYKWPLPVWKLYPDIDQESYRQHIQTILSHIRAGDTYQVNHTLFAHLKPLPLQRDVDPAELFLRLQPAHRFPYAAFLRFEGGMAASFSPELFLKRQGDSLTTAPIKGTRPRSDRFEEDILQGLALRQSVKDRAEHVMIVDMARNDLGRVCRVGSVKVDHLFEHRVFSTVHHLETRVRGQQRSGMKLDQLMAALFPAASITGAPKYRTMEIIQQQEARARGLYTGSIGVVRPGGDFIFNVAIRTVTWLEQQSGNVGLGRIGLGGGIVADSDADQEWVEIADKGRFLHSVPSKFQLIETFLQSKTGQLSNWKAHIKRLAHSAYLLGFYCDTDYVEKSVYSQVDRWFSENPTPRIVRLLLEMDGSIILHQRPCVDFPKTLNVVMAGHCVDRLDPLLRHKTTRREPFNRALEIAKRRGYDETLFCNNLGRLTEGSIRALLVCIKGQWYTPPLKEGLLASVWRAQQMQRLSVVEQSLTLDDLKKASEVYMGNSVQGGVQVVCLSDTSGEVLARWPKRRLTNIG